MLQSWKPFLHREARESQAEDETQVKVSDDGPPHQSSSLIVTLDAGGDPERG